MFLCCETTPLPKCLDPQILASRAILPEDLVHLNCANFAPFPAILASKLKTFDNLVCSQ
jgi:hypothetical protein